VQSESSYAALFQALAEGRQVEFSLPSFNRLLRLGAGASLVLVGFLTSNWLVLILGSLLAFLGVYDRCPVWKAISGGLKKRIRVQQ
jgi:thioredoxin 1